MRLTGIEFNLQNLPQDFSGHLASRFVELKGHNAALRDAFCERSFWVTGNAFQSFTQLPTGALVQLKLIKGQIIEVDVLSHASDSYHLTIDTELSKLWYLFQRHIADFFVNQNFLSARTPTLVVASGTEANVHAFRTQQNQYLVTSSEFSLKKILSQDVHRVFELRSCFRQDALSKTHSPEFLMCEWYRAYADLSALENDVLELVHSLSREFSMRAPTAIVKTTVAELFQRFTQCQIQPVLRLEDLPSKYAHGHVEDAFWECFLNEIEPRLDPSVLYFVSDFPQQMAAYAKIQNWAQRFEIYWQGLELGNAYLEVTDPDEQLARLQVDAGKGSKDAIPPIDQEFIQSLRHGLPPCSGIAVGVDRLFMAMTGVRDIRTLWTMPYRDER